MVMSSVKAVRERRFTTVARRKAEEQGRNLKAGQELETSEGRKEAVDGVFRFRGFNREETKWHGCMLIFQHIQLLLQYITIMQLVWQY